MKNVYLIEMLLGCSKRNGMAVSASNPDGQPTVKANVTPRLPQESCHDFCRTRDECG